MISQENFIAILIIGKTDRFWYCTCPCGINVTYPINKLPTKNTKFPCKNKDHWVIKFQKEEI